jgi:hypothetical protein
MGVAESITVPATPNNIHDITPIPALRATPEPVLLTPLLPLEAFDVDVLPDDEL